MSEVVLSFFVPGHPKTKGSLDIIPGRRCHCCADCKGYVGKPTVHDTPGSSKWRQLVAYQAKDAIRRYGPRADGWPVPAGTPVAVDLVFDLPAADVTALRAGDLDKLERNVLDALTDACVYVDDVQVVAITSQKRADSERPGVSVFVRV